MSDDVATFVLLVISIALTAFVAAGISNVLTLNKLCTDAGYDGREVINGTSYCYTTTEGGVTLVELTVPYNGGE